MFKKRDLAMFFGTTAQRMTCVFITISSLMGTTYPGRDQSSKQLGAQQQHRQRNNVAKKNVIDSLYHALCKNDHQQAHRILSRLSQIKNPIKSKRLYRYSLLERAVKQKNCSIVSKILEFPQPIGCNLTKAYNIALKSGSHRMIKTLTRRSNVDPTKRDESGESIINKLAQRNKAWADNLCSYVLMQQLQRNKKANTCMVCLATPQEIIATAAQDPADRTKKPKELMNLTTCCHGLLCEADKASWLASSEHKDCPNCRKPL